MKLHYLVLLAVLLFSCDERVKFDYEDAKRNEIAYFFEDNSSLNFYHDIDNSKISGHFTPEDIGKYAASVDSACIKHEWTKIIDDADKKMYLKKESYHYSIVTLIFWDNKEVILEMSSF
ncbi:MAG: hypothetical protein KF870_12025 [Leadbetterella sp.]|nr:hypothetical protein [Leadbetterella sp.]